jgi:hypothetical protein
MCVSATPPSLPHLQPSAPVSAGFPRIVDEGLLRAALAALDAVINCEPFADVSPPGTEGFLVYEEVAAAREFLAAALGESEEVT